jgi:hypothetical protein
MKSRANRNQTVQDASSSRTVKRRKTGSEAEEHLDDDENLQSRSYFLSAAGEEHQVLATIGLSFLTKGFCASRPPPQLSRVQWRPRIMWM